MTFAKDSGAGHPDGDTTGWRGAIERDTIDESMLRQWFAIAADQDVAVYRRSADEQMLAIGMSAAEQARRGRRIFWRTFSDATPPEDSRWESFGNQRRFVPEILLVHDAQTSTITVEADSKEHWQHWQARLANGDHDVPRLAADAERRHPRRLDESEFRRAVTEIAGAKALPKAVIASRLRWPIDESVALPQLLGHLSKNHPQCLTFAISPGVSRWPIFVGATPEVLATVRDKVVATMALAGTIATDGAQGRDQAAEQLMNSPKDRREHRFVRDMIAEALDPLCQNLDAPESPQVLHLRNLSHLHTPIRGTLKEQVRLSDVVTALHPTPAVCGTPREAARRFIVDTEPFERGLYTGVFGWEDGQGNGQAHVLLRAGLVDGKEATLFAGAGITADSDVDAEWREVGHKFEPLVDALKMAVAGGPGD